MNQNDEIWPPPTSAPDFIGKGERSEQKLLTGATWTDIILACLVSFAVFSLLTFTLFNPVAASILLSVPRFSSGPRLLIGWALASVVHAIGWAFLRRRGYISLSNGVAGTIIPLACVWLFLIVIAWWMFS